jgi:hypothetical protein
VNLSEKKYKNNYEKNIISNISNIIYWVYALTHIPDDNHITQTGGTTMGITRTTVSR